MYPIYCINLENRTDRKIHSINEFNKINILLDNVKYPHFIKDPRGGIYGCFDSHMKIWNDFYKNYPNEKYCLIFEDDFELVDDNFDKTIKETVEFIDKNYNYIDILNLHDYYYIDVNHNINICAFINIYAYANY